MLFLTKSNGVDVGANSMSNPGYEWRQHLTPTLAQRYLDPASHVWWNALNWSGEEQGMHCVECVGDGENGLACGLAMGSLRGTAWEWKYLLGRLT